MSNYNLLVRLLLSLTLLSLCYASKQPSLPTDLDYLDPETWTHLSQNVLLHDLESPSPSPTHQIRHFTHQSNSNAVKGLNKKGNRKGQRQNNNGNNGSYNNNNKGKQGN